MFWSATIVLIVLLYRESLAHGLYKANTTTADLAPIRQKREEISQEPEPFEVEALKSTKEPKKEEPTMQHVAGVNPVEVVDNPVFQGTTTQEPGTLEVGGSFPIFYDPNNNEEEEEEEATDSYYDINPKFVGRFMRPQNSPSTTTLPTTSIAVTTILHEATSTKVSTTSITSNAITTSSSIDSSPKSSESSTKITGVSESTISGELNTLPDATLPTGDTSITITPMFNTSSTANRTGSSSTKPMQGQLGATQPSSSSKPE
ncbi:unnamed protein product [Cylicocyclus nassatus]|uniref:Uncharacterized protein n=1 Tax=Cylicocyclus nassatus TaxID=53992 RepID=A0AA36HBE7_CYLNA|nr:unnamed protein product [Cylicocyclus nassatus]